MPIWAVRVMAEVTLMSEKIEAYFLRCDQGRQYRGYVGQIENTLKAHQSYVGGLIQAVSLTPEIIVICNDEGKLQQLQPNRAWVENSQVLDYFAGSIICVRHSGDEFASIKPEDIAVIESLLIPLKSVSKVQDHLVFETYPADHCPEWRPFYAVDYSSMSPEERYELMSRPQDDMEACFEDEPREVQRLALTLIFTRWWNSYKHMAPEEPTPEIIGTAIELLWDFLEGKCGDKEFTRFQIEINERIQIINLYKNDSDLYFSIKKCESSASRAAGVIIISGSLL